MSQSNKSDKWQKIAEEAEKSSQEAEASSEASQEEGQIEFPDRRQLEDQLTAVEKRMQDYQEQTRRAQAELENVRRRSARDIEDAYKYNCSQMINALLPVFDGLVHGLESGDPQDPKVKPLHEGMQLTLDLLQKALAKFGVEVINPPIGDPFDPKLHEAVGIQPLPGAQPNTIAKVLQRGYRLHDRVLRAAMVMVAG